MEWKLSCGVLEKLNCPKCNGQQIALILWGYPKPNNELEKSLENKEIILGGCLVIDHDPKWECTLCYHRWGERDED